MNPPAASRKSCTSKQTVSPAPPSPALQSSSLGRNPGNSLGGDAQSYRRSGARSRTASKSDGRESSPSHSRASPAQVFDIADKMISVKEAAFRLGKSEDAIYRWLRTGRLRGFQPGGRACSVLVLESSVEEARQCALGWLTAI